MLGVQLCGTGPKTIGVDAPTLELEEKSQTRPQQIVQVVDRKRAEGVRIERGGDAASQLRHQLLLEQLLSSLVENPHLARGADQVRELVEQAGADAVKGPDPRTVQSLRTKVRAARRQLAGDTQAQLLGGAIAEGHGEDAIRRGPLLDQPAEPLGGREGLACPRAGRD